MGIAGFTIVPGLVMGKTTGHSDRVSPSDKLNIAAVGIGGMVLSNTTGHAGDAIWRREFGETYSNMCEWLPRWIGKNAQKYKGRVAELPVDQHMLLACIAPRPLFISSGEYDYWADSKGAWISAYNAIPIYKMYRQNVDFKSEKQP